MGYAHLGFFAASVIFAYMAGYALWEDSERREFSKRDDKSRLEYARNPRVYEEPRYVLFMIGLFFVICLFGHLAGSPWADLIAWAESRSARG